jgi:hypothetical protein
MSRHTLAFIYVNLLLAASAYGQPVNNLIHDVVVPPPNVASLGKFTEIPVDMANGIPSITIPIYTIQQGPLSVPISLDYHASGIRVAETASWVGTGWTLKSGGMVSRTVLGFPMSIMPDSIIPVPTLMLRTAVHRPTPFVKAWSITFRMENPTCFHSTYRAIRGIFTSIISIK